MSLINKVLKDLESRKQPPASPRTLFAGLTPAPMRKTRPGVVIAMLLLIIAAVLAGIWFRETPRTATARTHPAAVRRRLSERTSARLRRPLTRVAAAKQKTLHPAMAARSVRVVRHRPVGAARKRFHAARKPVPGKTATDHAAHAVPSGSVQRRPASLSAAERARGLYGSAISDLAQGARHRAVRALRRALVLRPGAVRPRLLLAGLEIQKRHYHRAQRQLKEGLTVHPTVLDEAQLLAHVDLRLKEGAAAVKVLRPFAADIRQSRGFAALFAGTAMAAGDTGLAYRSYRTALVRYPYDGRLWVGLGICDLARGQRVAAQQAFHTALHCSLSPVLARFAERQLQLRP